MLVFYLQLDVSGVTTRGKWMIASGCQPPGLNFFKHYHSSQFWINLWNC